MYIKRDYSRLADDDFKINVQPLLNSTNEAEPIMVRENSTNFLSGWLIKDRFE